MASHRLLLIEDNRAVADFLTDALAEEGYALSHAASPEQAVAGLLTQCPFDLVVSDAFITQDDAPYAWLAHLRGCTAAPIIICSGWPAGTFVEYQARGFAAVLAKPFDLEELLALVATCGASSRGGTAVDARVVIQEREALSRGRG